MVAATHRVPTNAEYPAFSRTLTDRSSSIKSSLDLVATITPAVNPIIPPIIKRNPIVLNGSIYKKMIIPARIAHRLTPINFMISLSFLNFILFTCFVEMPSERKPYIDPYKKQQQIHFW